MKRIFIKSCLLIGLISCFFSVHNLALAECDGTGKANGESCNFEDCECATDICKDGVCVGCASDSDCSANQTCVQNSCQ